MKSVSVVAPGKLFVVGEYAVLRGGRALVAAVDAGIRCSLRPTGGGSRLRAPDLGIDSPVPLDGDPLPATVALLAEALAEARRTYSVPEPFEVSVEASHPSLRHKTGLGGSGAAVVAILGAVAALAGDDPADRRVRARIHRLARDVHRRRQRGGSGADIAASVFGGWIGYDTTDPRPVALPDAPFLAAVWSGRPVSTPEAIGAFERYAGTAEGEAFVGELSERLGTFWSSVESGDVGGALRATDSYGDLLRRLAGRVGFDDEHTARLVHAARDGGARPDAGVAVKPSGAVGGDCVIAFGFDPEGRERAVSAWRAAGGHVLDVAVDPEGVRMEAMDG